MLGSDQALSGLLYCLLRLLLLPFFFYYVFYDYKNYNFVLRINGGEHAVTEGICLRRGDGEFVLFIFCFWKFCFDVCLWLVPRFSNGFEYLKFRGR